MTTISIPTELLGIHAHTLPNLTLPEGHILADYPLHPGHPVSIYHMPGHPGYVVRKHSLHPDTSTTKQVLGLLAAGLHHYDRLARHRLFVPPHRHIEATLPSEETEGRVLSLMRYMPAMQPLQLESIAHLPATLHAISGLSLYAANVIKDGHPEILWDIFRRQQLSVHSERNDMPRTPLGVFVHDYGLAFDDTYQQIGGEGEPTEHFNRALVNLTHMANVAQVTARDTSFELQAAAIRDFIHTELPPPRL
ncbi:MAG TPA: hypothetical protein VLI54_05515 [Bacillota bacterium]|nr:hypothetical protein [Bacillota bacterium]